MEIAVYKIDGQDSGKKVVLDDTVFGIEPNNHALYLDIKQYLANQRQGTHKAKERWEIAHSTKKIVRQKGSGGARHGSLKAGTFVGGGRIFGPQPRDYRFKLNKKLKQLARRSALTYKAQEQAITVLEPFSMDAPKTKDFLAICRNLKVEGKKILMVLPDNNNTIYLSSRNVERAKVVTVNELNTYDIVNAQNLILIEGVEAILSQQLGTSQSA
ncbi:MAG TPA: 50S ribosomal protein L4 [Bacteroidales bacterium]|mgnify:FL=1|jgi:large subunit ribosomal protein L4|nr:50S ribosomal protein L4 [Bacteroidales bacterium]OQC57248.1 MAG: 50S ribosomal protein L4 [Bacteroidetes bacterium ADurb.Bin013]MBV6455698.1 50S ribosomal protein L4 [Bacteroidales bacterium]HNT48431.1 50S ribosomal protein L4 [Bacteroidales bacterium]HNW22810.1 50S ribosomal protein L4 [Bacteroidales bacterium]